MTTVTIGQKDFRQNISKYSHAAKEKNITYIVTKRNKPMFEVKPCLNENIEIDAVQIDHYKNLENILSFWNDDADDDLFAPLT